MGERVRGWGGKVRKVLGKEGDFMGNCWKMGGSGRESEERYDDIMKVKNLGEMLEVGEG